MAYALGHLNTFEILGAFHKHIDGVYEQIFSIKMPFFAQRSCLANIYSSRWVIFFFYSYSRTHGIRKKMMVK